MERWQHEKSGIGLKATFRLQNDPTINSTQHHDSESDAAMARSIVEAGVPKESSVWVVSIVAERNRQ